MTDRTFRGDPGRLRQLFENLFRNAVEHGSTSPPSDAREDAVEHGSTSSRPPADDTGTARGSEQSVADAPDDGDGGATVTVGTLEGGFYVADDGPGIPPTSAIGSSRRATRLARTGPGSG